MSEEIIEKFMCHIDGCRQVFGKDERNPVTYKGKRMYVCDYHAEEIRKETKGGSMVQSFIHGVKKIEVGETGKVFGVGVCHARKIKITFGDENTTELTLFAEGKEKLELKQSKL